MSRRLLRQLVPLASRSGSQATVGAYTPRASVGPARAGDAAAHPGHAGTGTWRSLFKSFGSEAAEGGHGDRQAAWQALSSQGVKINPCNSPHHPAVVQGGLGYAKDEQQTSVQEAYTPLSACYGCGPAASGGLGLRSFRSGDGGLVAQIVLGSKYCAFPGVLNGGVISTLFECHGNWTAAIALMDRACLPRPALTLTSHLAVDFKSPAMPDVPLTLKSQVLKVTQGPKLGVDRPVVEVRMELLTQKEGKNVVCATAVGVYKKMGALRAL